MTLVEELFEIERGSFSAHGCFTSGIDKVHKFFRGKQIPDNNNLEIETNEFSIAANRKRHTITITHLYDPPGRTETISFDSFLENLREIETEHK